MLITDEVVDIAKKKAKRYIESGFCPNSLDIVKDIGLWDNLSNDAKSVITKAIKNAYLDGYLQSVLDTECQ